MQTRNHKRMIASLALVVILLALLVAPVGAQSPIARLRNATITFLTVSDTAALDALRFPAQSSLTIVNDTTITPTGSYQPITAAGAVGTSSITAMSAGYVLTLVNTGSNTITFTDTGTLKLSGNAALGQYDALKLMSDGTNWIQVAPESDN